MSCEMKGDLILMRFIGSERFFSASTHPLFFSPNIPVKNTVTTTLRSLPNRLMWADLS